MTRKKTDVESSLTKKGFRTEDGDHRYFLYFIGTKLVAKTKTSRGTKYKDLSDELIGKMARDCHITKSLFLDLVDCPLSQEQYELKLREQGLVD